MSFIESIKEKVKANIRTIVLPETEDERVVKAVEKVNELGFAKAVLLNDFPKKEEYAEKLYELRKEKGLTLEEANELINNPIYYAVMMIKNGDADGMVAGASHATADVLRPALQIIKTSPDTKLVSALFLLISENKNIGEDGVFIFADSGLNDNPNAEELSEIAITTAGTFEKFTGKQAKVAMLSYSTYGSAESESIDKVREATRLVKEKSPNILIDGEIQFDAAVVPNVAEKKAPNSLNKGRANVFIFPDLNSGNIGYKIAERLGNCTAIGPIIQGIARPINDLSRGCSTEDIVDAVAITALQAQ